MKYLFLKLIVFSLASISAFTLFGKSFECEYFSFEYPQSFKQIPINNAPNMLLKLQSDDYYFSASYINTGISGDLDLWNDEVFEYYSEKLKGSGVIINKAKETLETKSGNYRCMKIMTNLNKRNQGKDVNLRMLSYVMIFNGDLFIFSFMSNGQYIKTSPTTYPQNVMKGIKFKSSLSSNFDDSNFKDYLIDVVKSLNAQCPIEADECTTFLQAILSGRTIIIKTRIYSYCKDFIDYTEFKNKLSKNYSVALEKPFVEYLDNYGYSILYMVYDESDNLMNKVSITAKDILYYY